MTLIHYNYFLILYNSITFNIVKYSRFMTYIINYITYHINYTHYIFLHINSIKHNTALLYN